MESTPPPQQPGPYGQAPQTPYPPAPPAGGKVKIDTADTFDRLFKLYGAQFMIFIGTALVVLLPVTLIQAAAIRNSSPGLAVLSALLALVGNALYTGTVVEAVRDMRDGRRDFGIPELLRSAAPFILRLILTSIVFFIGAAVSLLGLIVGAFVFMTFFCLFAPAIVIERQGVFGSLQRSRDLVRGNAWRVFGVVLVAVIVAGVANNLITRLAINISDSYGGALVGNIIGSILTAPVFALAVTVLYFQLRDIREGTQGLAAPAPPPAV